jgi:hypothetical protein
MKTKQEIIAEKAYHKYIERGRLNGFDQQDWLDAEQEIKGSKKKTDVKATVRKTTKNKK